MKILKMRRLSTYRGQWGYSLIVTNSYSRRFVKVGSFHPFSKGSDSSSLTLNGFTLARLIAGGVTVKNKKLRRLISLLHEYN